MSNDSFLYKKSLGQHFLNSPIVPAWMCDAASVTAADTILEIGPGTGVLTSALLERGAHVIALETDPRAVAVLTEHFVPALASGQLVIHQVDVRSCPLSDYIPNHISSYKVVANIPYYLSGYLFRTTLTDRRQPSTVVFLVQKEVAKRAHTTQTNNEKHSLLSLSVGVFGTTRYIRTVPRGHFSPPPKVDSAIIAIDAISRDFFQDCDEAFFFYILKLGFGNKRKQLLHNLAQHYPREQVLKALQTSALSPTVRAEDIDHTTWKQLVQALSTVNVQS